NDKNSEVVRNFWDQQKISDLDNSLEILSKETKLQMAIADLKYVINKSEEATIHSDLIGERRGQILKSELKHKRKVINDVTIHNKDSKTDEEIPNETDNKEGEAKKRVKSTTKMNYSSKSLPSSPEEDEGINFDFTNIEKVLFQELTNELVLSTYHKDLENTRWKYLRSLASLISGTNYNLQVLRFGLSSLHGRRLLLNFSRDTNFLTERIMDVLSLSYHNLTLLKIHLRSQ
ncbi:1340_t:CDS:2, partial [Funneliformis caledonium]